MAICQFYLSEKNRKCIGTTLALFGAIQVILGGIVIGCGLYFHIHLDWKVALIEDYDATDLFKMIISVGGITVFLHMIGGKMCYDCGIEETRTRFDKVLFIWRLLVFFLGIMHLVVALLCFRHTIHARNLFHKGFMSTMKNYLKNTETKYGVDILQIDHDCCGAESFRDWMTTNWVPYEFNPFQTNPDLKKEYKEFYENMPTEVNLDKHQLIVTPFSCCDLKYEGVCFHDFITQPNLAKSTSPLVKGQWWEGIGLNKKGCVTPLMLAYNEYLTYTGYFYLVALGNQMLIVIMTKYLQTSIDNIPMFGRDDGTSPGWLCNCELI